MHPIGIALAFLTFWSLATVGIFLFTYCGRRLRRGNAFWMIVNGTAAIVGLTLTGAGVFATYIVLYAR